MDGKEDTYMFDEELAEFDYVLGGQVQGLLRVKLLLDVVLLCLLFLLLGDGVFGHLLLFAINSSIRGIHDTIDLVSAATICLAPIRSTRCAHTLLAMIVLECSSTVVARRCCSPLLFAIAV